MNSIDSILSAISDFLWGYPMIILLVGTHILLTIRLKFPQRKIFTAIKLSLAKDKDGKGDVSQFGALATALAATIGTGNIIGVGTAIALGGPGAVLWCWLTGVFGIATKYGEGLLAVKYRKTSKKGYMIGGPMYALEYGLHAKWAGVLFALFTAIAAFGIGSTVQANAISNLANEVMGIDTWITGIVVTVLVALVIIGGIKSIAKVTTILTPTMCVLYIISGLIVIFANFNHIWDAIVLICNEAFHPTAVAGGVFGTIIIGLRRSVQSNEAGTGAAAIVYATAQTKEHVSQGFVALLETFLTGVLCLFTSLAIVSSGVLDMSAVGEISGIELASNAFQSVIPFFPVVLSLIAVLFAMSTLISWAYYGQKAWTFLLGEGKKRVLTFNLIYCMFIVIGSVMNVKSVIDITDAMMIALCIPNVIVLYILAPEIKRDLKAYLEKHNMNFMKF